MCGESPNSSIEKYHIFPDSVQLKTEAANSGPCIYERVITYKKDGLVESLVSGIIMEHSILWHNPLQAFQKADQHTYTH